MSVTPDDVRSVASLARVGVDASTVALLVDELNGILSHMTVLQNVDLGSIPAETSPESSEALRADEVDPDPLQSPGSSFAPEMRDGFFLVPRLASHGDDNATGHNNHEAE